MTSVQGIQANEMTFFEKMFPKKRTHALLSRIDPGSINFTSNFRKFLFMNII